MHVARRVVSLAAGLALWDQIRKRSEDDVKKSGKKQRQEAGIKGQS